MPRPPPVINAILFSSFIVLLGFEFRVRSLEFGGMRFGFNG